MEKFSLDEYLKNPSRKVVTKDGRKARIICTDAMGDYPLIALVEAHDGAAEQAYIFTSKGSYYTSVISDNDLFFAPEKHEGWVNVYEKGTNRYLDGCICVTKEEAKRIRGYGYITTIKIEWEE